LEWDNAEAQRGFRLCSHGRTGRPARGEAAKEDCISKERRARKVLENRPAFSHPTEEELADETSTEVSSGCEYVRVEECSKKRKILLKPWRQQGQHALLKCEPSPKMTAKKGGVRQEGKVNHGLI